MSSPPVSAIGLSRRTFLQRSLAATAGIAASPQFLSATALGAAGSTAPSNRITVGLIGHGCMGAGHLHRVANDPAFQLLAVADPDNSRRENGKKIVDDVYASRAASGTYKGCAAYNDYRDLLARSDIDAVVIVTPDHWHALQSIDAAMAGKDIYCEKPLSMTIHEGRRIVTAVQRYGRVFQTGTQYRSIAAIRKVCDFVRGGGIGKVKSVFTQLHTLRNWLAGERFKAYRPVLDFQTCGNSIAPLDFALPAEPVPDGLDWDMWVGPAPWRPYNRLYHINPSPGVVPWSFADAFGVTSSTWFLSHAADVIQWAIGMEKTAPVEIIHPADGRFPTWTCRYANGTWLHFIENWGEVKKAYPGAVPENARLDGMFGGLFVGERGWITSMSNGGPVEGGPESLFTEMGMERREVNIGGNNHHANWLECIRTRKAPSADEEIGHRSATLGHLLNIASWVGGSLTFDPVAERFVDNEYANRLLSRPARSPWNI